MVEYVHAKSKGEESHSLGFWVGSVEGFRECHASFHLGRIEEFFKCYFFARTSCSWGVRIGLGGFTKIMPLPSSISSVLVHILLNALCCLFLSLCQKFKRLTFMTYLGIRVIIFFFFFLLFYRFDDVF